MQPAINLLPNLLIVGAAKAGTTALHEYLGQHPDIFMTNPKEPRFFLVWNNPEQMELHDKQGRSMLNTYHTLEKYTALFEAGKEHTIRGESSPHYLVNAHCAQNIKQLVPHSKIIVVLRNPVDRAFSHYVMHRNWKVEKQEFEVVIEEEWKTGRLSCPQDMRYLFFGKYADQLKVYLQLFEPGQLKIYLYDDFKADGQAFIKNIFQFLGVDDSFVPDLTGGYNVSFIKRYAGKPKRDRFFSYAQRGFRKLHLYGFEQQLKRHRFYKPVFKPELRKKMLEYYKDEITELELLLNRDLSKWRV